MMRILGILGAAALGLVGAGALAQTPAAASDPVSCPRGRLSIYYASGDVTASPQAQMLIGRISETATSCEPDGIDLVARIDARVDGDRAVSVALERLGKIADDLVAQGVPVERIRIAAQSANSGEAPGLNQVDVVFHKAGKAPEELTNPVPPMQAQRTFTSPSI